jgi:hypothetical protein
MYIRTKTRTNASGKTYTYAYLARMKSLKRHPKQKIVKYLGRVYTPKKQEDKLQEIQEGSWRTMLENLLKNELKNHGYKEITPKKLQDTEIIIDLETQEVKTLKTGKRATICMNQGLLCNETLKKVVRYRPPKEDIKTISKHFAKTIVEAGIMASNQTLMVIFKKIQTMINSPKQCQTMPNTKEKI